MKRNTVEADNPSLLYMCHDITAISPLGLEKGSHPAETVGNSGTLPGSSGTPRGLLRGFSLIPHRSAYIILLLVLRAYSESSFLEAIYIDALPHTGGPKQRR